MVGVSSLKSLKIVEFFRRNQYLTFFWKIEFSRLSCKLHHSLFCDFLPTVYSNVTTTWREKAKDSKTSRLYGTKKRSEMCPIKHVLKSKVDCTHIDANCNLLFWKIHAESRRNVQYLCSFYGVAKAIEEGRVNGKMGQLWWDLLKNATAPRRTSRLERPKWGKERLRERCCVADKWFF